MIFLFHLDLGCAFVCSTLGSPVQTGREQAGAPPAQGKEGTGPGTLDRGEKEVLETLRSLLRGPSGQRLSIPAVPEAPERLESRAGA